MSLLTAEGWKFWVWGMNSMCELMRTRHSTLACLALIEVRLGLGVSFRNTVLFRVFHILHNNAITWSMLILRLAFQLVDSICNTVSWGLNTIFVLSQLWEAAKHQHSCARVHHKNKWSISSISDWQKGRTGSIFNPCLFKVPLVGSNKWQLPKGNLKFGHNI